MRFTLERLRSAPPRRQVRGAAFCIGFARVDVGRHPAADGVVAARQEPGVVGVQALDPLAGAADAAVGTRAAVVLRQGGVALGGVALVSVGQG